MARFELTEWIARPPAEVFDFLADMANAPKVSPVSLRVEKLTDGPVGVGTRYRETRLMDRKEHQVELEVTTSAPPIGYAVRNVTEGVETVYHYYLGPEGAGTRVRLVAEVSASGLKKAIVPMLVGILKREDGDHLTRMKAAMESHG
jgi:hypothetical protein